MPTTPNGTAYTVYSAEIAGNGTCYWGIADSAVGASDIPTILYAHGADGNADQFASQPGWQGLRNWMIDNGWAWVEGGGGTTDTLGKQNWGNDGARSAYPAYLAHVEGILDVGQVVLLGRSMGGLITAWLYARSSISNRFSGWINNSGVSTLFVGVVSDPNTDNRPSGQHFSSGTYPAYSVSSYSALSVAAADHAPESWPASSWGGKNIICLYGNEDHTVPWYPRGGSRLQEVWAGQPAIDETYMRPGGDHTQTNGSYLDVTPMTNFMLEVTGGTPEPPVTATGYSIDSYATRIAGVEYELDLFV